jgi:hypothetical protein
LGTVDPTDATPAVANANFLPSKVLLAAFSFFCKSEVRF